MLLNQDWTSNGKHIEQNQRPQLLCVLLVHRELRIDLAHDATVGERCRKQKFSYGFTKIHLGVHLATSDWIASTYLCRSRAEAFKERG